MKQSTLLGISASIVISLILAIRNIGIAIDDDNYLYYFTFSDISFSDVKSDWWNFLLNEPLWLTYSSLIGSAFKAESALRITVFAGSLMFLVATGKLSRGAWLFIILAFVIDPMLATQMYFNQIRQGFALGIFLTIAMGGVSPILAGVVASLIHSSFLVVTPCFALALVFKKLNIHWVIAVIIVCIGGLIISKVAPDIDFGRRTSYELKSELTLMNYLVSIFQDGLVLYFFLRKKDIYDDKQTLWLYTSLIYFVFVTCLTLIHEAAGRLMYLEHVFLMISIGMNFEKKGVKNIALFWLVILFALEANEARKPNNLSNTWLDRWSLILNIK